MTRVRAHYLLAIVAGAALPLAFAPFHQFWLAPLSYAALLYVWGDATPRRALGLGFAYGCASFGFGTYWTFIAVRIIGGAPIAVGAVPDDRAHDRARGLRRGRGLRRARGSFRTRGAVAWLVTLPALFVLAEWLRGWLFTGFGWLAAGYSQTDSWLMGYAPLGGILAMSSGRARDGGRAADARARHAARARRRRGRRRGRMARRARGARRELHAGRRSGTLDVALAQGNIAQETKYLPEQLPAMMALYAELTKQGAGADLVIWPEAAIPTYIELRRGVSRGGAAAAAAQGSTVLLGILRRPPAPATIEEFQNILVALTDEPQIYVKRHLVPFGEFYPGAGFHP